MAWAETQKRAAVAATIHLGTLRPPSGPTTGTSQFDPDHPLIEDLKRTSFTAGARFSEAQSCAAEFPTRFARACRRQAPLMRFLARAVGLSF